MEDVARNQRVRKEIIAGTRRLVLKVGTRLLADIEGVSKGERVAGLVEAIAGVRAAGVEVILVTSGAIGAGMSVLGETRRPRTLPRLQAHAAVGQSRLMYLYESAAVPHGFHCGQLLLTAEDLHHRTRHLNAANCIEALLALGVLPVINENDSVSVDEIRFGDNDILAALVALLLHADLTVLLTTVDGLRRPPEPGTEASWGERVPLVQGVPPEIRRLAGATDGNPFSTGGMASKLHAADMLTRSGEPLWIVDGHDFHVLEAVMRGEDVGTLFIPAPDTRRMKSRKRYLAFFSKPRGSVVVDPGAARALATQGRSLLPKGVVDVQGEFHRGDTVRVVDPEGNEIARGISNYSAQAVRRIRKRHTRDLHKVLGAEVYDEVIHRNYLVLTGETGEEDRPRPGGALRLECGVQHYAWGERAETGTTPYIADLLGIDPPPEQPFAELWIGAHPQMPARVVHADGTRQALNDYIAQHPHDCLGPNLLQRGVRELPFLLKILTCTRPLSIQAHPDRRLAARLHRRDPAHYPDPNPKPEIAIGLRGLRAICRFRPAGDVARAFQAHPALRAFFSADSAPAAAGEETAGRDWLRRAYAHWMRAPQAECVRVLEALRRSWEAIPSERRSERQAWFLKLLAACPGDRGVLSVLFFNLIHLAPGEGIFIAPGEPHAYLEGAIIECMGNSNNVVRAGLTPKFMDTEVLLEMLDYQEGPPRTLPGREIAPGVRRYAGNAPEFRVDVLTGPAGAIRDWPESGAPGVMLVLEGEVDIHFPTAPELDQAARRGSAWFIPAAAPPCELRCRKAAKVVAAAPDYPAAP